MAEFIKRIFAVILSFLQMLLFNVNYGERVEPQKPEKEETQLANDISGDTSLADSIKFASEMPSVGLCNVKHDINFFCFCCSKILLISGNIFTI